MLLYSKKLLPYPRPSRFSPMISSRNFIVLCFTCRPIIHFEIISVKSIKSRFFFFFFACGYPIVLAPFVEKAIFASNTALNKIASILACS